jgi:hypothetical protein
VREVAVVIHAEAFQSLGRPYHGAVEAVVVLALLALLLAALTGLARRARRRGTAGAALAGAMAAYNEAWHSTAYDAHVERQAQTDRVAPSDSPRDL